MTMGTGRRVYLAVATAALVAVPVTWVVTRATADASRRTTPPATPGWAVEWSDDFAGPRGDEPDGERWRDRSGDRPRARRDGDGRLAVTGTVESGRGDLAATPGGRLRVEAVLRLPDADGDDRAVFRLADEDGDRATRWDVVRLDGDRIAAGLRCERDRDDPCDELGGDHAPAPDGFHTYAVEHDRDASPERLTFSVDGEQRHTVTADELGPDGWERLTGHGMSVAFRPAGRGDRTPLLVDRVTVLRTEVACDGVADWDESAGYQDGDVVTAEGRRYTARRDTHGERPGDNRRAWADDGACAAPAPPTTAPPTTTPPATTPPTTAPPTTRPTTRPTARPTKPTTKPTTTAPTRPPTTRPTSRPPAPPAADPWTPFTTYAAGDRVTFQGRAYRCRSPHVSLPGWDPARVPGLWQAA